MSGRPEGGQPELSAPFAWCCGGPADPSSAGRPASPAPRLKPDYGMACNSLGNALRLHGDLDGAVAHFQRAAQIDPNLAEAHSNLGQLLLERHQPHEALAHLRAAVRLRPDFAEARNNF